MPVDVIGIDHVYLAVSDLVRAEAFYDRVMMEVLGFRKGTMPIAGEPHRHYYNRHYGFSLRPARSATPHDPYAPGLHHFCFRVEDEAAVRRAAGELRARGIDASEPRYYPEYAPDYFATFFEDPDGIRLEITNFRENRKQRMLHWDEG
ncbi:MAG TPA: VOC family protein [Candidatus Kryptonia bacterium]|nr:VOC family protein [Candidatus Kryptonia bacterium]